MVPVRRILGVLVVVLGIVIVGLGFTSLFAQSVTAYPPNSGEVQTVTPQIYGGGSLMVSWNGAGPGTVVTLYNCGSACPLDPAALAALPKAGSGSGASGSFSASVTGGTTYGLVENGTASSLVTTTQAVGLTTLDLIGIVIAIVGVILIALPMRRPAGSGEEAAMANESAEENLGATMPAPEALEPAPVTPTPVAAAPAPSPEPESPPPEAPVSVRSPAPAVSSDVSAAQANARGRPNLTCAHCGAVNEPWITNCRRCKRPLSKTG
ncbi:MAG TPA: hypothetical protein VMH90_05280 [Thermoplasmata archaeon]|nr:hypothetical protein [Thermoplasmata archaeon]